MGKSQQAAERAFQATRKNFLINGNMDIWQRGTSGFGSGVYAADRWATNDVSDVSRSTDVPSTPGAVYSAKITPTVSTNFNLRQNIENGQSWLSGREVTVSFWGKADSSKTISTQINDDSLEPHTLTTTWTRWEHTTTVAAGGTHTFLDFHNTANDTVPYYITQVQLELGGHMTAYEYRLLNEEIAMCQRYYCKTFDLDTAPADFVSFTGALTGYSADGGFVMLTFQYPVQMRSTPVVTTYNPGSGGGAGQWRNTGDTSSANALTFGIGTRQATVYNTGGTLGGSNVGIHLTADAEI